MADPVERLLSRAKDSEVVMCDFLWTLSSARVQAPRMKVVWFKASLGISKADAAESGGSKNHAEVSATAWLKG